MKSTHNHYAAENTNIPIQITGMEYFGPEQNQQDLVEIVAKKNITARIIGRFDGLWDGELDNILQTATKVLYADHYELRDYLYEVQDLNNCAIIKTMPGAMGFVEGKYRSQIQLQRPGCTMTKHFDPESIFDEWSNERDKCVRVLIALAPWEHGQIIGFDNIVLTNWNKGDIIYCDFTDTWHYTANCSWHSRPLLQVSGVANDNLLKLIYNKEFSSFQI